jgi:pantoate--beta-alanine ligase
MQIIRTIKDMQALSRNIRDEHKTIGLVPTMGALHEGHMSLMKRSGDENEVSIVSIFVNPIQFGPKEDFMQYPRDIEGDLNKLSSVKVDIVFFPDDKEMYPDGFSTSVNIGSIGEVLCGASRPGHFNGVATVVVKLFNIVMPDNGYFGQKDFQQTVIIKKINERIKL